MYVFPSFVNLYHQLASALVPAVDPALLSAKVVLALRFVEVITFHVSESISYLRPNSSNASILSIKSASRVEENDVVKLGIIALTTAPCGTGKYYG